MSHDSTEEIRRAMLPEMPEKLKAIVDAGGKVWTTTEMSEEFDVLGFVAPCVVVSRKSDGKLGSLTFTHRPRFYFDFVEDT